MNQRCSIAQGHYSKAMQWENRVVSSSVVSGNFSRAVESSLCHVSQAQRDNNRAQRDAYWDGGGFFERNDQRKRGRDMNAGLEHAGRGSQELQMAFSMIPPGCMLRQRYGGLMARVGTVPVPVLSGGNFGAAMSADFFGGEWGALSNDWR